MIFRFLIRRKDLVSDIGSQLSITSTTAASSTVATARRACPCIGKHAKIAHWWNKKGHVSRCIFFIVDFAVRCVRLWVSRTRHVITHTHSWYD